MISYGKMGEQLGHFFHKRARHDCRAESNMIWLDNCLMFIYTQRHILQKTTSDVVHCDQMCVFGCKYVG